VFVNEPVDAVRTMAAEAGVRVVQLHGDEPAAYADRVGYPIFRSVTLDEAAEAMAAWADDIPLLLDAADRTRRGGQVSAWIGRVRRRSRVNGA
jgi:phosphoribosylanthranilate isomerase